MLLDKHRTSVGFQVDCEVLSAVKTDLLLETPSQMLNLKLNIGGGGEEKAAEKVSEDERAALFAQSKATM